MMVSSPWPKEEAALATEMDQTPEPSAVAVSEKPELPEMAILAPASAVPEMVIPAVFSAALMMLFVATTSMVGGAGGVTSMVMAPASVFVEVLPAASD